MKTIGIFNGKLNFTVVAFLIILLCRIVQMGYIAYLVAAIYSVSILMLYSTQTRYAPSLIIGCCIPLISSVSVSMTSQTLSIVSSVKPLIWSMILFAGYSIAYNNRGRLEESLLCLCDIIIISIIIGIIMQYVMSVHFRSDWAFGNSDITYTLFELGPIYDPYSYRMRSIYGHPIIFAVFLVFALFIFVILDTRRFRFIKAVFCIVALILTQTRSMWIVAAFGLLIFYIYRNIKAKKRNWNIIALLPILLSLVLVVLYRVNFLTFMINRFAELSTDFSFTQRFGSIVYVLGQTIDSAKTFFFGNGFGASDQLMLQTTVSILNFGTVDNQWVACFYDFGLPCTLLLFGYSAWLFARLLVLDTPLSTCLSFAGVFLGVFGMCFFNLFSWDLTTYIWFLLLGCSHGLIVASRDARPRFLPENLVRFSLDD